MMNGQQSDNTLLGRGLDSDGGRSGRLLVRTDFDGSGKSIGATTKADFEIETPRGGLQFDVTRVRAEGGPCGCT